MKIHPFKAAIGFLTFFLSVLLFLTTSGFVSWNLWLFAWQFWPALFVIFGVALLMRRRKMNFYLALSIFALLFGALGTGLWITWKDQYFNTENYANDIKGLTQTKLSNEMPKKVDEATVKIALGSGKIKVGSLENKNGDLLFEGLHESNFFTLAQKLEVVGDKTTLSFKGSPLVKKPYNPKSVNDLSLNLSQKPIYSLDIETGASNVDLDLKKLKISKIDLDAAASEVTVKLGENENQDIKVKSGASSIKLLLPKDAAIKINSKSAFTEKNYKDFGLLKKNKSWESPNFKDSKKKVSINIDLGVSKLELVRY